MDEKTLRERLFEEVLLARQRVYAVRGPTPMERLDIGNDAEVWVKREDVPPIYAYKWRGAYNRMATLTDAERARGVVCASAGNHAQGVALAAAKLGCAASVFMPRPTPMVKQQAVALYGGAGVSIELIGDSLDSAYAAAIRFAEDHGRAFVHPYDDLVTMGGQGTLADEVVMSGQGVFDVVYLQIGGGGMAAAVACWLKHYMPGIRVVGVEAEGQASMAAAVTAGRPVELEELDIFCDGTAIQQVGTLTYPLCRELIDEFITVSNQEVCSALRRFWTWRRGIVEPSGALGLAGLLSQSDQLEGKRALAVMCGANMDFSQLGVIAAEAGIGGQLRKHLRFEVPERPGTLLRLMQDVLEGCKVIEFQYGRSHHEDSFPVIGFDTNPEHYVEVERRCAAAGIGVSDVSLNEDVEFRVVNYNPELFKHPMMLRYEFPERLGALPEFLERIRALTNICYFNYRYTGERVGRALVGLEFESHDHRQAVVELLERDTAFEYRHRVLPDDVVHRMLSVN